MRNVIKNKKLSEVDLNKSYKIILKPIVTEKATRLSEYNKVVFAVSESSNKIEIKGKSKSVLMREYYDLRFLTSVFTRTKNPRNN